jgi:plastocyanin
MMPPIARRRSPRLALAVVLVLAGLVASPAARLALAQPSGDQAGRQQDPATVTIGAHEYGYDAPDTLPSGTVNVSLQNTGSVYHMAQFLRLNDGVSADDLQAAVQNGAAADALDLGTPTGGPNAVGPGDEQGVTLTLPPGNYVMLCLAYSDDGIPHAQKGMVHAFTVTDDQSPETPPAADLTVTAQDFSFAVPTITPGQHTVQFDNHGSQAHEMALVKLPNNANPDELQQALPGDDVSDDAEDEPSGGISGIAPGQFGWATVNFTPGTYVFICYMKDTNTGLSHAALGMAQIVVVQGPPGATPTQPDSSNSP